MDIPDRDTLSLITSRLSNQIMEVISHTPLWNDVKHFASNQNWWHERVENLTKRHLKWRIGDWARVYASLDKNGIGFDVQQDYGSPLLVEVLLELGLNPGPYSDQIMRFASRYWNEQVVRLLMQDGRVDFSANDNSAIIEACENGQIEIVRLLLSDPRVDPSDPECIESAIREENSDLVDLLLQDDRVDPSENNNQSIILAVNNGDSETVALLLSREETDPSVMNNIAIKTAAEYGFTEIVRLLLTNPRVQPFVGFGTPLEKAVMHKHAEIVRMILARDVEGSYEVQYHQIFLSAVKFSTVEIVRMLLDSGHIDLGEVRELSLRLARKNGRTDMIDLLLGF